MDKPGRLNFKERTVYTLIFAVAASLGAWLFYDAWYMVPVFFPVYPLYIKLVGKSYEKRRTEEFTEQFLRALISLSSSMAAGISAENAFAGAADDMEKLYGKKSAVAKELAAVNSRTSMGENLKDALFELANRVRIPEVYDFAVVFSAAKEKGADFGAVISSCVSIMEEKRRAESEARVLIRAKQYEQRVMCAIPPGILVYLRLSSGSFIEVLYHNATGIAVMSVCLAVYVAAICMSEKIGDVSV